MIKSSILRYGAIGLATLGFVGVAAASSVTLTGPNDHGSSNNVTVNSGSKAHVASFNATRVDNFTGQGSFSGNASASNNTTVGSVGTGSASNSSVSTTSVTNSTPSLSGLNLGMGTSNSTVSLSGPNDNGSHNTVTVNDGNSVHVMSVNLTSVDNDTFQMSGSGNASAHNNTTSGNVTSGSASSSSTTTTTISNQ